MPSAALIYNPMSGRRRGTEAAGAVLRALGELDWRVEGYPTQGPGMAGDLAREVADSGAVEVVFALGGDGTLREVACGLLGRPVALGPLPGGTSNVLVRSLGLPSNPVATARRLAVGARRRWHVGLCGSTPFLMMASAGYDAEVVRRMDGDQKARWGELAVVVSGIGVWWRFPYPRFEVVIDGEAHPSHFAVVSNLRLYGHAFVMAPAAEPEAERLELVNHFGPGRFAALGFARDLVLGRHLKRRDVQHRSVTSLELVGPADLPLQIDGDRCDEKLPVRIGLADDPLEILVG